MPSRETGASLLKNEIEEGIKMKLRQKIMKMLRKYTAEQIRVKVSALLSEFVNLLK